MHVAAGDIAAMCSWVSGTSELVLGLDCIQYLQHIWRSWPLSQAHTDKVELSHRFTISKNDTSANKIGFRLATSYHDCIGK